MYTASMSKYDMLSPYISIMRLDKPVGILLLLWPTLWALWLASQGMPDLKLLGIFVAGVCLMRSAGCVINDIADRHVDKYVRRTQERPLAAGTMTVTAALFLFIFLSTTAFLLVLLCNPLTIQLAFIGIGLAIFYPLMKRFTHLPQIGLGAAFSWGVPMAFAAKTGTVPYAAWFLFLACLLWPIIYDTLYAMVDRDDDIKAGVKSTAIWFAKYDRLIIGILQIIFLCAMGMVGYLFGLHPVYYLFLLAAGVLFLYQQWLIRERERPKCFQAFLNNQWLGLLIFIGIFAGDFLIMV